MPSPPPNRARSARDAGAPPFLTPHDGLRPRPCSPSRPTHCSRKSSSIGWARAITGGDNLFLQRADDFREWGGRSLWRSHFTELKERQRWKIRTPDQFWKVLAACTRFVVEETRRNPDFVVPDQFLLILARVKPMLDEIWPQIENRYRAIQAKNQALALQAPDSPQFTDQVLA
jgi:hypothetical protein